MPEPAVQVDVCRKLHLSALTADGERPSTRRKVRFMWLWSQKPASAAMPAHGWSVSRNRRAARSTRNRAAVSSNPSPVARLYDVPSQEGCRPTSRARSSTLRVVSSLRRRVIVPTQFGGSRRVSLLALSTNRCMAARKRASSVSRLQNCAKRCASAPARLPSHRETGAVGMRPSHAGSNSISICSNPCGPTVLRWKTPAR